MKIRCKSVEEAYKVIDVVRSYLERSRFNLSGSGAFGADGGMHVQHKGRRVFVSIVGVRLNVKKGYCGNHAGPCRLTGRSHRSMTYLEGTDWVSFDTMLNDALDSIEFSGDVASSVCIIRKGKQRRMDYYGKDGGEFDKDTDALGYADYCGKEAPFPDYQWGTPGIQGWGIECTESPYEEAA